jgi:hypothetical protein
LRENFDHPARLAADLASARDAVRQAEAESDDPCELREFYRNELTRLEMLAALPPSIGPDEGIERLRKLYATSGEGSGCVIDVTHVYEVGGMHVARTLQETDVVRLCGSAKPTAEQAAGAIYRINEELDRGDSVCFAIFDENGSPSGWYFVGNTID